MPLKLHFHSRLEIPWVFLKKRKKSEKEVFCTRRCWSIMIPVRKSLRVCKVSFKILFIRAKSTKKERIVQIILPPFRCWKPRVVQHRMGLWSARSCADPACTKDYPMLVIWATAGSSYNKTSLFIISTVKCEGYSQENFLLHFQRQARPRTWPNRRYQAGAALQPPLLRRAGWVCPVAMGQVLHTPGQPACDTQ